VFWNHFWDSICSYPERSGDLRSIVKATDFYSIREYRRTPMYTDELRPQDLEHFLMLCLHGGPGRTIRLHFWRCIGDRDFSERDRALLALLRPHLHAAHYEVQRRRHDVPTLTERQWQIMRLVDAGYDNTQLARRLDISPTPSANTWRTSTSG
jgi:DNA-binding CsgD family transcriptional regulator